MWSIFTLISTAFIMKRSVIKMAFERYKSPISILLELIYSSQSSLLLFGEPCVSVLPMAARNKLIKYSNTMDGLMYI